MTIVGRADWLTDAALQRLLAALSTGDDEARIVGGAVRNALLGEAVADIDIATTTLPEETVRRAEAVGFRTVPTGLEHGTITVIADGRPYEVTTLRTDLATDGRRATVGFGRDWRTDAERRDFTINALYATADGRIVDLVGGMADLDARVIRFIGDAEARIREDYLRILRFFRFFAWYGSGRPDSDGVRVSARLKDGLGQLSAERVWAELKRLLAAPDPSRALLWMRQAGVLTKVLPESEKWGIDAIHGLVVAERDLGWAPDPILRIAAIVPPDPERVSAMAARLKMSNADAARLDGWARSTLPAPGTSEAAFAKLLYAGDAAGLGDRLKLALAAARASAQTSEGALLDAGGYGRLLKFAGNWQRPIFPVAGADLKKMGAAEGKALGATLKALEAEWIASGFALDRDALLARAAGLLTQA